MKKILMTSVAFLMLATAATIFQMTSCKKAEAQTVGAITQLNKLVYSKIQFNSLNIPIGCEIWTSNYDGTSQTKINIVLPSGIVFSVDPSPKLAPNGQKLFFLAGTSTNPSAKSIYSCDINGGNVMKIVDGTETNRIAQVTAY